MRRGVFVTAIGTECGKTYVSAALLRALVQAGNEPTGIKPLMSGYDPEALDASDAGRLLAASGRTVTPETVAEVCWRTFPDWLAPNVAARRANVPLSWDELLRFMMDRVPAGGPCLVEGAGGVMSPLTDTHTNLDLIATLGLPVVLVTTNYLGAVSHTLTALDVLDRRNIPVGAIVISEPSPDAEPASVMADELRRWTILPIAEADYAPDPTATPDWARALASSLFA